MGDRLTEAQVWVLRAITERWTDGFSVMLQLGAPLTSEMSQTWRWAEG